MTNQAQAIQPARAPKTLQDMLASDKIQKAIAASVPQHVRPDRLARIAMTALSRNPDLARCTSQSFFGALLSAAQLGFEVNSPIGHAYVIPFMNNKINALEATLIIGYQGFMDLAWRSGQVCGIYAHGVFQGDEFVYELGLNPTLRHLPARTERVPQNLTDVYGVARIKNGEPIFVSLTKTEVETYRGRSRSKNNGPWVTDYVAMAQKTAIRRLFRWLPKSSEMSQAVTLDQAPEVGRHQLEVAAPEIIGMLGEAGIDTEIPPVEQPAPEPVATAEEGKRTRMGGPRRAETTAPQQPESRPVDDDPENFPRD